MYLCSRLAQGSGDRSLMLGEMVVWASMPYLILALISTVCRFLRARVAVAFVIAAVCSSVIGPLLAPNCLCTNTVDALIGSAVAAFVANFLVFTVVAGLLSAQSCA